MKKIIYSTLILLTLNVNAQKWKDKLNDLSNGGSDANATSSSAKGDESQFDMVEPFVKSEKVWQVFLKSGKLESISQVNTKDFIKVVEKNNEGKVSKIDMAGGYASNDNAGYPLSYTDNKYKQVIFVKNVVISLNIDNGTNNIITIKSPEDVDKLVLGDYSFDRIFTLTKADGKDLTIEKIKEILKAYFKEASKGLDAIKQKAADAEAENRSKYSIKDKKVKSIEIACNNESISYKESVAYSIIANLTDGTKITAGSGNQGYMDDYKIEVIGMEDNTNNDLYNMFKYTPTDKVTLKVTSKYHPNISTSKIFKMKYEIKDIMGEGNFKFSNQAGQSPYNGINTRVEIKQVKDLNTGETLIACKIFDLSGNKPHFSFKCKPSTQIEVIASGKNIVLETDGAGKNGYSGGDVKIIVDPSITEAYNLNIINSGGRGQRGKLRDGLPGKDGKTDTVKQKVTW